jgi:hypothetical protein
MRRILGVDPGGTTGLCVLQWEGELPAREDTSRLLYCDQVAPEDAEDALMDIIRDSVHGPLDLVAIEKFTIGPGTHKLTRSYDALYLIGLTRALCRWAGVPMQLQGPGPAKKAYDDNRLKDLGFWVPGDHARDAIRHALLSTHT